MDHTLENKCVVVNPTTKSPRNYELDFLRLVFAILIFLAHTQTKGFIGPDTRFKPITQMGPISVHFFFIVSGMLMVKSILKNADNSGIDCGKAAIDFVLRKFKSLAWLLCVSGTICVGLYIFIYIRNGGTSLVEIGRKLARSLPELFEVSMSGINLSYNSTWFISSMLICMLPLAYLMYRKRNFTLYVFAPLAALLSFGYMCWENDYQFFDPYQVRIGGNLRAICGLCFGICAYTICDKIKRSNPNKHMRVLLTVAEALLYLIFFATWIFSWDRKAIMSVALLLPIAVAITFSDESYISRLFRFKWMKYFAPMSLYIYLIHNGIAMNIVKTFYPNRSWKFSTAMSAIYTIIFSLLCWSIICLGKMIWEKKLKTFFTKPDES